MKTILIETEQSLEWRDVLEESELDPVYKNKAEWVKGPLQTFLKTMPYGIVYCEYYKFVNDGEIIVLHHDVNKKNYKVIDVSCDNEIGMIKDIVRQGGLGR